MFKQILVAAGALTTGLAGPQSASSHPHVFAQAHLEIVACSTGALDELRHVWRFDPLFTSSVILQFDANANNRLDDNELSLVANILMSSTSNHSYFQSITMRETDVTLAAVEDAVVSVVDQQLTLTFTS